MLVARRSAGKVELASGTNSTARSYSLEMASGPNVVRQRDQGELQAVASRARAPQLNARTSALLARYFGPEGPQHDALLRRAHGGELHSLAQARAPVPTQVRARARRPRDSRRDASATGQGRLRHKEERFTTFLFLV